MVGRFVWFRIVLAIQVVSRCVSLFWLVLGRFSSLVCIRLFDFVISTCMVFIIFKCFFCIVFVISFVFVLKVLKLLQVWWIFFESWSCFKLFILVQVFKSVYFVSACFGVVVGSWLLSVVELHKFFVIFSHLQVVEMLKSWVFDSSRLSRLVLYTHTVSHAQFLWCHYTHCVRTGYGTLPDVVTPHLAQGYDENGVCLFCACHKSRHLAFLSSLSSWSTWLVCSTWILVWCFLPQGVSAHRHRWRGVWLPGHILPPHRFRLLRLFLVVVSGCSRFFWSCLGCFRWFEVVSFLCVGSDC